MAVLIYKHYPGGIVAHDETVEDCWELLGQFPDTDLLKSAEGGRYAVKEVELDDAGIPVGADFLSVTEPKSANATVRKVKGP